VHLDFYYYYTDMFSRVSPLMSSLRVCSAILYPENELWKLVCAVFILIFFYSRHTFEAT